MKAGTIGALIVLAGGALLAGALFAKDKTQLTLAQAKYDEGGKLLASGKPQDALDAFVRSLDSALNVGGISGARPQAIEMAGDARNAIKVCEALVALQAGDTNALATIDAALEEKGPRALPKEPLEKIEAKRLAQLSLTTADSLEKLAIDMDHSAAENVGSTKAEYHRLSAKAFEVAARIAREGGFDWATVADQGAKRSLARALVAEALAANAANQGARARELAEKAARELEVDPFPGSDEAARLKTAVRSISAEGNDRAKVNAFEHEVTDLAAKVGTNALGALLPAALAVKVPELEGGHAAASELDGKKIVVTQLLEKVKKAAADFEDMILARDKGDLKVYVDRTEVTNEAFRKFMDEKKPYTDGRTKDIWGTDDAATTANDFFDASLKSLGPATWTGAGFGDGREKHPVAGVSAFEARAFARALGKRLPSYDEWLGAAGAPGTAYPWGNEWKPDGGNVKGRDTAPAGSYPAGAASTGAVDLIGNVREIVEDGEQVKTVGGSYLSTPDFATLTAAVPASLTARPKDQGFRCARELRWKPGD